MSLREKVKDIAGKLTDRKCLVNPVLPRERLLCESSPYLSYQQADKQCIQFKPYQLQLMRRAIYESYKFDREFGWGITGTVDNPRFRVLARGVSGSIPLEEVRYKWRPDDLGSFHTHPFAEAEPSPGDSLLAYNMKHKFLCIGGAIQWDLGEDFWYHSYVNCYRRPDRSVRDSFDEKIRYLMDRIYESKYDFADLVFLKKDLYNTVKHYWEYETPCKYKLY